MKFFMAYKFAPTDHLAYLRFVRRLAHCAALSLVVSTAAYAQTRFEEEFDDETKPWQEIAIQLPAAPQKENLLEFYVSPTATQTFAVDAKSVSVGDDGVVRYTLVSLSASGARNVSYEGIRCAAYEKKLYAFGHEDGTWSRSRRDKWELITGTSANRQHAALARDYFCDHKSLAGNAKQIVKRLRYQQALLHPIANQFLTCIVPQQYSLGDFRVRVASIANRS
jgi:hypothetical protein